MTSTWQWALPTSLWSQNVRKVESYLLSAWQLLHLSPVNVFMALVLVRALAGYNSVHLKFQKLYYWINMEWCLCPCLSATQVKMIKPIGMIYYVRIKHRRVPVSINGIRYRVVNTNHPLYIRKTVHHLTIPNKTSKYEYICNVLSLAFEFGFNPIMSQT